jgi:NCS1 nucleoside transporter family
LLPLKLFIPFLSNFTEDFTMEDLENQSPSLKDPGFKESQSPADNASTGSAKYQEYRVFQKFERFAENINAEVRGIERVPEYERTDTSYWNPATMWLGGNMVVPTFALGTLGITLFFLSFWDAVLCIIFFNLLGALAVAYYSTFGPIFGLRQMVLSRFWFGYQTVRFIAFINCIACVGWSAVNTMVSAQMLHTVNNGGLPPWAGVLVISAATLVISFFGYRVVHTFEKYSWIPTFAIFIIVAVRMAKSHAFDFGVSGSGPTEAASVLSFGGTIFGFAVGWSSYASDYTVYMPVNANRYKIFFGVLVGLMFPLTFGMILGAACATGINNTDVPRFAANYAANSVGGLLYAILVEDSLHGFGQFCQVMLAISTIANNIPNMYSLALSAQTVWSGFRKVPRVIWTVIGTGLAIAIAIPAYYHFENVMQDFMDIIGYWLAIYSAVLLNEHFIYKKGKFSNYRPELYDDKSYLAVGYSAAFAFACGIAGAVSGMSQVWYVGRIAIKIGGPPYGGDIGFELAFAFATIGYNMVRWLEIRLTGR